LDGSQNSFRGLNEAIIIARNGQAIITGVYVTPLSPPSPYCEDDDHSCFCDLQEKLIGERKNYEEFFREHVSTTCPITPKLKNSISYDPINCELELISGKLVTGSYELEDSLCIGSRGMIVNENCEIIGKYDPAAGIPIVENKEQCDMLEGDWNEKENTCDLKYR